MDKGGLGREMGMKGVRRDEGGKWRGGKVSKGRRRRGKRVRSQRENDNTTQIATSPSPQHAYLHKFPLMKPVQISLAFVDQPLSDVSRVRKPIQRVAAHVRVGESFNAFSDVRLVQTVEPSTRNEGGIFPPGGDFQAGLSPTHFGGHGGPSHPFTHPARARRASTGRQGRRGSGCFHLIRPELPALARGQHAEPPHPTACGEGKGAQLAGREEAVFVARVEG